MEPGARSVGRGVERMERGAWGGAGKFVALASLPMKKPIASAGFRLVDPPARREADATFSCSPCGAVQKQGDVGLNHFLRLFAAIPSAGLLLSPVTRVMEGEPACGSGRGHGRPARQDPNPSAGCRCHTPMIWVAGVPPGWSFGKRANRSPAQAGRR